MSPDNTHQDTKIKIVDLAVPGELEKFLEPYLLKEDDDIFRGLDSLVFLTF